MASQDSAISHIIRTNVESLEEMNIRTFTKWINSKLGGKEPVVKNLIQDLQDGHVLLSLLEVLLKVKLRHEKGKLRFHKLNNVNLVLKTLEERGLKLHGISNTAIVDGNKISILGLIWMIILHFQVQGIMFEDESNDSKSKGSGEPRKKSVTSQAEVERILLKWAQDVLKGFSDVVPIDDIVKSWQNGLAFVLLLYVHRPSAVDSDKAYKMEVLERLEYAFTVAEKEFEVHRLLDPRDVEQGNVDKKAMLMYLSSLYEALRNIEPAVVQTETREEIVRTTTSAEVESEPGSSSLRTGDETVEITTVSTNKIVLLYKTVYYTVLYTIKGLEERMEKIRNEEPSQENTKALREIQKEMQELQVKIKELNETNKEMAKAEGVDRQEFSAIQTELGELSQRWSTLIKHNNEENKRQPAIIKEVRTQRTVHTARLTIGDEVIEITTVSSNEIVIKYKIVYYQIITIIKLIESNMKIIREEEPSQKTARLLDENQQRLEQLQPKITEMNELMSQMKGAEGVDPEELSQLQVELADFDSRLSTVTEQISDEEKRQPAPATEIVYSTTTEVVESAPPSTTSTSLRIGAEVVDITTVSTNEIVLQYKTVYYTVLYTIKGMEERMEKIRSEEPSQENAKALREIQKEMQELQVKIKELNETNKEMAKAEGVDRQEFSDIQTELGELSQRWSTLIKHNNEENKRQPRIITYKTSTTIVPRHKARLTIGDEVIEITCVSSNEIVIKYKIVYYQIITIIKLVESNMKIIHEQPPSQETARLLDENRQRMEQLQPKITEMNELMSQMQNAEGVDPEELSQLQAELKDFDSRSEALNEDVGKEKKRQPKLTSRTVYSTTTTIVDGGRRAQLRDGDKVIEFKTVSTNQIVLRYKILYYEITTIIILIESNAKTIRERKPSQETARLLEENKQRMEQLQPKITELRELMSQMKNAEGVDPQEYSQLRSELSDFDSKMESLNEEISKEEKRQPPLEGEIISKTTTTTVQSAPPAGSRHATVKYGDQVFEITTVSTNEIVIRYKILYYEIITLIKNMEGTVAQIKDAPPSNTTAVMLKQNKDQMDEIQAKIRELKQLEKDMDGAEGVDANELEELQAELNSLDSRWTKLTDDIDSEDKRISSALGRREKQKASLDEWRKKCEKIGDWMDSIEDNVEVLENTKPSNDIMTARQQMNGCDAMQERIKSDEVPTSIMAYGEEIAMEPSISPDQKSKVKLQMAEIKKEIGKLSDRAGAARHRYKRAIDKLQAQRQQKFASLKGTFKHLDKQIDILKNKDDQIGKVEGDPAAVRAKETLIELLVSDIQVFQPRFDDFRQASWEVLEDPQTDQSDRVSLQENVRSLEERWGSLIRSVYSRSEAAKNLISKLPQGGVLEELIIVENRRHDYNLDWKAHCDLFGVEGHDQGAVDDQFYRERLMTRWKRECREVDEALLDVEHESSELGDILDDPSKSAMKKAKMEVIRSGLKKVDKEYNDLPQYANLLLSDPKLTDDDRKKIQDDLDSYKIRHDDLLKLVGEREKALKEQEPSKPTVVVTESFVPEKKEVSTDIIVPEFAVAEESAPDSLFSEPDTYTSSNAADIEKWWDDDRKVASWIEKVDNQVKRVRSEPASWDLVTTRKQHANVERITQEIGLYETNVTLLENKANALVDDPLARSEDSQKIKDEMKTVKLNWDNLKENAFNVERNLYERVNKLQEYLSWTQKSEALSGWLEDTERSLDSCATPSSDPAERERQTVFLEKFLKERGQNQESVDDVLSHGNLVVNKNLVPEQHLDKIKQDLKDYREKWNDLVKKAENVQERLTTGKKDLQKLESNQKEYVVITTWIIKSEKRLKELQGDTSGDDEALKKRRIVILEIIEEITVYRIRLRRLIEDNESLANKDTLPPEDKDKLVKDTKDLEKRLDDLDDNTKTEESSINKQLGSNTAKLDDWQKEADELDELIVATKTEIKSFNVPPIDENDKEKQKKYLEDFGKRKQERDDRVKDVVFTGRQLVDEGVIPSEKRQKFEVDLESIPGNWDDVVKTADELKDNMEKAHRSSDDYDNWCNDVAETKKIIEKQQQEVEACSTPTSDPEERKKHIVTITKIIADKSKLEERINETTSRGKELGDNPYLTPEQKEHIDRESKNVQVNWDDFANKLDDAKTSVESGEKDLQELAQYRVDYDVIITWITTNEKRLQDVKDDGDKDRESVEKRRVILKNITDEFPEYRTKLREVIAKGKHLSETSSIPLDEREEIKKQCDDLDKKLNTLENDVNDENKKVDDNLKNLDKYEIWQQKSDDLKEKLNETKENLDKFDTPTSEVGEREKQKRFLNDFNKKKPAQEKAMNDIVRDGQKLIDEDIVPTDKREAVEFDLQSLPETWNGIVAKADENKKTVDSSLQDVVQLNKWRNDYNVVLLWIEKAEEKPNQRDEEDTGDLDKLKKQRRKLETDVKDIVKYEPKIAPLLSRAETVSQSTFIIPEDAKNVEEDGKTLKERFDKLKVGETERKQKLDYKIQWLTDYKQYRTDADALNVMLDDNQKKLESCEKPTSNKAERDKQASFLNQFVKNQDQNNKAVDKVVEQGNGLANAPGIPEDKGDEIKEETKTTEETWKIMVLKVEELQKIVTSGIQNITELGDWRKEYTAVIKWIETNEKKLTALGEPGEQHRDLSNKCTTLDEMVNLLPTYETRVVLLLEKGDQLAKEPSIDEADRKQTEDDTKALRERWDRLKADEQDKKKRFDDQKGFVEDYHDWKDNVGELKPFLDNTKKEMDACELPTSDHSVREKQAHFIKTFSEDKDKNQTRIDNVTDGGESLLKQNPVAQKDERDIRDTIDNTRNSWNTILQRFDGVEQSVTSGAQDIIQLEEWRKDRNELSKSLDNARQQVRTLKKPSKDPVKMKKQKDDFELISSQIADSSDKVGDLSQKAEYLTKTSSISPKDKDKVSQDMEQLNNTWKNYKNDEDAAIASFDAQPVEPITEVVEVQKAEDLVVQGAFEEIDDLFKEDLESPEAVDYGEWKDSVAELEGILDKEDGKFDPKSEIEKEYANLEKLAQETKDSGSTVDDVCKPKLAKILSDGNALVNCKQVDQTEEKEVSEKMMELKDRTERVDTAVTITRMKVRDAALKYFNDALNECSVNANNMQETAKTLQPANDLTGVRVQIASMKALHKRLAADGEKVEDIEKKVDKMEDAGVLPRDGFAGTLNDRCHEVKKEQQIVNTSLEEARPKLHRALINQLNRTQKTVNKWLKLCEKKERNIDVANVKDLEKARQECLKLKQAKAEFDKGDPVYITLTEVHKEAVDDGILVDKKAAEFEKQMEGLTTRHDELKKRLGDKEIALLDYARQSTEAVLNSAEEKLEEQKTWLEPEDPADNFTDAKEQQDKMKDHESAIKERTKDVIVQLGPVERIATGEILPLPEATALQGRITDVKTKFNADIPAAKDKLQKMKEGYSELLKKEMEKRKAWIDEHVGRTPETDDDFKNFKDFNEFKVKYDQNEEFARELGDNNIQVLIEEADKIDGIEPELKDELKDLNERWDKIHDATKDRTESYEDLMSKWGAFREQQLTLLNWVDEKDAEATGGKEQVNLADEDETAEYIKKLKAVKDEAEVQGASQEKKLREASEDLIQVLGEDSPSAAEVNKQVEEVDSVRQSLVSDIGTRIEKIESSEQKTKDLYSNMDDVTTWMDSTEKLIDTYENQEKQAAGDDGSRDLAVPHVGEVPEEMVHVVEEILAKRKEIPERELRLNNAVTCVGELDDQLDETTVENARENVNDMKDRWGVVTQRLDDFCNRDIPEIEIAEIKAENLETELLDETDAKSVVPLSEWEEKVRKVNLLLKYVERLVGVKTDGKMDYPSIRIIASNTKEATKTITKYCKPQAEKISTLGYNIVDADPHNIDQGEKITTTIDALNKRIEHSETGAAVLKLKVHDTALDYFNNRLNHCEIALESEEENANKLTSAKPDLETTQEQMVLLKEGRKEFDKNQEDYKNVVDELKDKKVAEFLSKDGFQGTVGDKSDSIKARREAVDKKLKESKTRIYRNLITHLTEMKKNVAKWLTSCEKKEKAITVDPTPTRDPVAEYRKLKALREEMDASEPKYDATIVLNQQLINDRVLEGRKATNSEKELQSFATRYAAIGKHYHDKRMALYTVLLNLAQVTMDEVEDNIKEADTKVEQTRLAERFPQVKQDFQNAKDVKNEVDEVCEKSKDSMKDVHAIVALDVFNDNDRTKVDDRRNELKNKNAQLEEKSDEKFDRFAKQYNEIIENEVKNRKMWLDENESWMNINDNDVDELAGFAKKLEEQKIFQEELERRKMVGLIDEARDNEELSPETRFLIYDLDDKWNNLNNWSEERLDKLNRINVDWKNLREQERGLLDVIDDNDSRLKLMSSPVDLSDKLETENQRNELKDLQSDAQVLGLNVVKIHKSSNDLIKLVGPDSSAGKRMEKEFEDISTCHAELCKDALARLKKLDASERKTKVLYDHMDDINAAMDESENILKSLDDEIKQKQAEEKKDKGKENEINENAEEAREDEDSEKKDKSPELNKFVDQISLRRGERPEEVARVTRAKELETSLEEYISDEAKDMLQKQLEDFDNRWEDVTSKMDEALKDNAIEEPEPIKAFHVQEVESALPEDQTVEFSVWKDDAAEIDESMLKSQTALQAYDVDIKDYSSLKKTETETQNIIDRMNTEFKPKLITLRSSGEKIPDQDPAVTSDQVDDIVNSSQKNLEGVQSALQLRKFRLHDSAVQHMNERILECEANVGEEEVKLQLLTPPGKDLDTVLDQLSALQESEETFRTNQVKFEEVQVDLNELKQSKILTSPEFQEQFQDECKDIAIDRAQVLKQTRDHKNKLYRAIMNIFDMRKKEIAKWLKNCEKKGNEIPNEVQDLDQALIAVKKIQETEEVLNQGERNYHETAELAKTISENEILADKKAKDAENDMKNSSLRYNQLLEDVQNKKNKLYKTIHELLTQQLDETEDEIKKAEDVVQVESQPEDPTATHEELANLQVVVSSSDDLKEQSGKLFDKAHTLLSADIFPQEDKRELRKKVIDQDKRAYDLPEAAKDKYEQVYTAYLTNLTKLIQLRTEWITANEPRMEQVDTTDASDISDMQSKLNEHEEFESDLKKNNIRSVLEQIRDTSELDPDIPLSDLLSLEKRWEVLNAWAHKRNIFLLSTLDKWKAFRQEEMTMIAWIDAKDTNLQELDVPINLTDENAVQERLHTLRDLQTDVNLHLPNLDHFKNSGKSLLEDLKPESEGAEQVKKQIEDFKNCWKKLEKDIVEKIEKMEKSNRTIKAIHNYMDVVNNWLDDTDGKLNKVDSSKDELRNVIPLSALPSAEHSVDGGSKEEPVDQTKEDDEQPADKTWDAFEDIEASKTLSEDEKEQLQDTIEQMTIDIKANSRAKDLNKARIERVRLLVDDIHDDVDEDGVNAIEEKLCEITERCEHIDTRLKQILQEEKPQEVQSEPELVTIQTASDIQTLPIEEQRPNDSASLDATTDTAVLQKPPIEPYSGKVTLNLEEWRTVATNLREFLHKMQMNIRDIHSENYEEMRECEVDTKLCIDAMEIFGKPCLNDLILSGNGMLASPEYTEEEKNEIRETLELLTVGAQFVTFNASDQRLRLYSGLISYQSDQKKLVQRWLNSCLRESRDINEDVAGLEASDAEYKKLLHLKNTLSSGEATFLHYKELSKRMIQNNVFPEKKIPETEKDIANFTTTYDNLRAETERKDKILYTTVVKSISLPLESIQLSVTEGENWVAPEELSDEYDQAKEQLNKMKLSVFVIETLHTRSAKVLKETEALVYEHVFLTPEDKQKIIDRVHSLTPRTEALPAAILNKYKRMNREYLVLIESEVERRDAWITKNEAKMTAPPAGDVQDLEGFLQLKEAHDDFLEELKRNEMSEFAKDAESLGDLKKATMTKIYELQTRWSELLAWGTDRTVYLNTVIANWQEYKQHEVTATDFMDANEGALQEISKGVHDGSDKVTKEKADQLENMRAETRENSLEIWEVQRQSSVLTKSIGEDAPVTKIIEQQTADLAERNEKLSQGILAGINGLEANQYKAKKLQEHINSVSDWTTSTTVFVDEFNEIAPQLLQTAGTPEKDKKDDATTDETGTKDGEADAVDESDEEKAKQEREEKINEANDVIHRIAIRRVDIGEYQATVDRINELQAEMAGEPGQQSDLDMQVEQLNTNWTNFNTAVDKVAWTKIPGVNSLQAVTYILHDMQITKKSDESPASVETIDQWKEKVAELESCVGEVEEKFKPEKDIPHDFAEIKAVSTNIQECQKEIDEEVLPKLEVIRLVGVKLCSPSQEADEEPQPVGEEIKREVSTTVLSLHEKIEHLQTIVQLQTLRLDDVIHDYFHERVRSDQSLLAQELTDSKRLFPVGEDVETMIVQLEIMKESENTFNANEDRLKETQKQFKELNELVLIKDQELVTFLNESNKNLAIQRRTTGKLYLDIEQKLHRNLLSKFNTNKTKLNKWLKKMEKREKTVDSGVEGVEKAFAECIKLQTISEDLPVGEGVGHQVIQLLVQISVEVIWSEAELDAARSEVNSLTNRRDALKKSMEEKRNALQTKVQEGVDETLGVAEKSISDAEAWDKPSILSKEMEQATAQMQQSMEKVTNVNNMYTQTMQSLKRPQEIAQSGVLPSEISVTIEARCHDLNKRVGRLPSVVLKSHKSLFEAFMELLHDVVSEREEWISQNETNVMASFVSITSLEDLKNKIQENKEFLIEIKKYDMAPVIVEIDKMSVPDFKLKASSKDLQSRLLVIEKSAEEKQLVLLSILSQWEAMRALLRELLDWIDVKDLKMRELKEQVNLADEDEVHGELKELKLMQTQIDDEYPEVVKLKKMGEDLVKILGDESGASAVVNEQVKDFIDCWNNLGDDIKKKIRKLESSERQLSTMHRYMDNTQDWMENVTEILDQHAANERRLQGLPVEEKPKDSEDDAKESKKVTDVSEDEPEVSEEKAEPEVIELDEDEKEKLREKNKDLVKEFVVKRQNGATCQAFVDWAGELGEQASEDLDDESKEILKIRIEKFVSAWDVFTNNLENFSQNNVVEIQFIEFQLAEQRSEDLPETVTFEEWKTDISNMEVWFTTMDEKCSQVNLKRDSDSLKKGEQDTKSILTDFNSEGKPHFNRIVVLGRRLIDSKSQTPEEEQEITITITKFTKRMIEVERVVELHRIRTLETIVDYCQERLDSCQSSVERDEVNMNQLAPSGSTPEAVHEQIVLLKLCEDEIPQHEEEFVEIKTYITETRHPGLISYETQSELERSCRQVEKRRADVDKQLKESHSRLYRTIVNFFEQRKKVTLKWVGSCERKGKQVKPDVKELKDSKNEYIKVKEVRTEFDEGRPNFVSFIEVHKLILGDDVLDSKKSSQVEKDVNSISGRVEQVDKILHEQETTLYTTVLTTLTVLLDSIESTLSDARARIKPDEVSSTYFKMAKKQMDTTNAMARDIQAIHLAANKQLEQGEDVKKAKLLGPEDADTLELRLSDLTRKSADLQEAAQEKELRMRVEYVMTFKTELQRCSQWIIFLESRVEKTSAEAEDYFGYQQLREDHIHFEEDLKVYDLNMLIKEVDKIDELEPTVKQELAALEKRWKKLLNWSEEKGLRLSKIVSLWSKYRREEIAILNWIDEKGEQLKVADEVNLANEEAVKNQLEIFKDLVLEREEYVKRSVDVEDIGHELKRIVGDNTKAGQFIQKQIVDLDQVFNELIKQMVQKHVQLESAQRRLQSMSEEMNLVNTWCNESEVLLNEYDVMEQKLQDLNVGYKSEESPESKEEQGKTETKKEKRARIKEEKAELREDMIQQIEKLSIQFEKLPSNETKVKRVNTMGDELKAEVDDAEKQALDEKLQPFNDRFNAVSQRLVDMANKDLPESSGCWFARFIRRKLFRASIN